MLKPIIEFDYWGLNTYLLMAAIGILFALLTFLKKIKKHQVKENEETKLIFIFLGSAVFGLLMSNFTNWIFMPRLWELSLMNRIEQAGFNFYGGILSFLISAYILMKILKIDSHVWMNNIVPSILIFHAFGRIGCSLSGCCYGIELTTYPLIEHTHLELFPAREIEAICLFMMAYIFTKKQPKYSLLMYLASYAVIRFTLEFFRGDNRGYLLNVNWSPAQVISVFLIIFASIVFITKNILAKKNNP